MDGIRIRNPKDCVRVFFMYLNMLLKRYCQEQGLSDNILYAVSIPASFEANQRKELMEALMANGMNVSKQSLIDEPNAAFISYVHDSEDSEKPLLISTTFSIWYPSTPSFFRFSSNSAETVSRKYLRAFRAPVKQLIVLK